MNTKILLLTLTIIVSTPLNATTANKNPLLIQIMQEHFNKGATDQDLIEARDERGYTILHVLFEKIALTRNTSELMPLFAATNAIGSSVKGQLNQALAKEGKSLVKDAELLANQVISNNPEMSANINTNFILLNLYYKVDAEKIVLKQQLNASRKCFVILATAAGGIIGAMAGWIIVDKYCP